MCVAIVTTGASTHAPDVHVHTTRDFLAPLCVSTVSLRVRHDTRKHTDPRSRTSLSFDKAHIIKVMKLRQDTAMAIQAPVCHFSTFGRAELETHRHMQRKMQRAEAGKTMHRPRLRADINCMLDRLEAAVRDTDKQRATYICITL